MIKNLIKKILYLPQLILIQFFFLIEAILKSFFSDGYSLEPRNYFLKKIDLENKTKNITHVAENGKKISFDIYVPNKICEFRCETFSTKEPEMLEWLETYGGNGPLFDIGANVGLYSLYYSLYYDQKAYAFEPSVFNLKLLAKNISLNRASDRIKLITNPLSKESGIQSFINSTNEEGAALNTFGVEYGYDGNKLCIKTEYSLLGLSLDDLLKFQLIKEKPSLIKIDVDGIEHLILSGAKETLKAPSCKSVFVEVNDNFFDQANNVKKTLNECGFLLKKKQHGEMFNQSEKYQNLYNQIWVKK